MIGTDYSLTISDDALNDLQNYIDYKIRKIRLKKYSSYLFYIIDGNNIEIIRGFHSWRNYQKYL